MLNNLTTPFLLNKRQRMLFSEVYCNIKIAESLCVKEVGYELIAYHLRESIEILAELCGKSICEQLFDKIFSDFCVGK